MKNFIYGLRRLLRSPLATALAIISLGFGLGANTAIFSIYEALVLRPLPVADPAHLVVLRSYHPVLGEGKDISYPLYKDLSSDLSSLSGLAARSARRLNLNAGGTAERALGEFVTENYYQVLGVAPAFGRLITTSDEFNPVAVLLYGCWKEKFGADPNIIGKKIFLNAKPFTVIGVEAPDFRGTEIGTDVDIQIPATVIGQIVGGPERLKQPRMSWLEAIGRLKDGIAIEAANTDLTRTYQALRDPNILGPDHLQFISGTRGVSPLRSTYSKPLLVLLALAGGVLLLTCLNLSNFLFARAFARRQQTAVLAALGAPRATLAAQPVAESILIAIAGTMLGFILALPLANLLVHFFPNPVALGSLANLIDWRVFAFSVIVAFACGLISGTYPAFWASKSTPADLLKEGTTIAGQRTTLRLDHALLGIQVLVSTVLVLGTTLFVRTVQTLENADTGTTRENLLFASLDPPSSGYDLRHSQDFYANLMERVRTIPGVVNAALSRLVPLNSDVDSNTICVDNYQPSKGERMEQNVNTVSPNYFVTEGIPMLAGRDFNPDDVATSPHVAIINQKMAQDFFASQNPIGHKIGIGCGDPKQANIEIVGVVSNALYDTLRDSPARMAYIPFTQNDENLRLTLSIRTGTGTPAVASAIRHQAASLDTNIPLYELHTVIDQLNHSLWRERMLARLSGFFSLLALTLCGLGIYSILNYNVQQRTKEIGLRMSLGASRSSIVRLVLRQTLRWTALGLALGISAGFAVTRLVSTLLYGVSTLDPVAILATIVIISTCAIVATLTPAAKAISLDPARVLRLD